MPDWQLTDRERELVTGGIDLHTHSAPSIFPRLLTDREMAQEAAAAGLRAVVLKAHEASTVDRAQMLHGQVQGVAAYGGIVLNHPVGGLNPSAVEVAIRMGARIVWMPTLSAQRHREYFSGRQTAFFGGDPLQGAREPITILDPGGRVRPEVLEIIALVRDAGVILSTGHLSADETRALAEAAFAAGLGRLLLGHPDMDINPLPLALQAELARRGAMVEKCYLACTSELGALSLDAMAAGIGRICPERCVLVTDYGQPHNISPARALARFATALADCGLPAAAIRRMLATNPAELLGL